MAVVWQFTGNGDGFSRDDPDNWERDMDEHTTDTTYAVEGPAIKADFGTAIGDKRLAQLWNELDTRLRAWKGCRVRLTLERLEET